MRHRITPDVLALVRRFTGDAFTASRGYDLRKGLNFGRRMAVLKYFNKISELTAKPTVTYRPKRGQKTEVFEYTGQKGWRKFVVALVEHVDPSAPLEFTFDKTRAKGSRFVPVNKKTGQRYYHLPGHWFLRADPDSEDFAEWLDSMGYDPPDEMDEDELERIWTEYVIDSSAGDAELFLIQAGDSYMWSSGGDRKNIVGKINSVKERYDDKFFDPHNKKSHHYKNWFKGVTAFTNFDDGLRVIGKGFEKVKKRAEKYGLRSSQKWRILDSPQYKPTRKGHWVAGFTNGQMTSPPMWVEYEKRKK